RIGGTTSISLDIRIITATNANLEKAVTEKAFRDDLYYYLNTLPIHIPPLKNRLNDMPDLIHHILRKLNKLYGRNVTTVSDSVLRKLCEYTWPGNVSELENVISRAVLFMNVIVEIIKNHNLPIFTDHQSIEYQ